MTAKPLFAVDHGEPLISGCGLYLDPKTPKPLAFVSHGHAMRGGPHTRFIATPETVAVCSAFGPAGRHEAVRFGEPCKLGRQTVTLHPSGHMLGSAMLKVESASGSLLYTGDFRLSPALTAEHAAPPKARTLLMEGTFADPKFKFPSREDAADQLVALVEKLLLQGATPVILAYSAGKAQEVMAILAQEAIPVAVTPVIDRVSAVYRLHGKQLGSYSLLGESVPEGTVIVAPPQARHSQIFSKLKKARYIALTGWAVDRRYVARVRCDHALPFSDHAGHDELLKLIQMVSPEEVFLLNGPRTFLAELQALGLKAAMISSSESNPLFATR